MATDSSGNPAVDFVWGNLPMQPNDLRNDAATTTVVVAANASQNSGWSGYSVYPSGRVDFNISTHPILKAGYSGYPAYTPNDDGAMTSATSTVAATTVQTFTPYTAIPSVVGLTTANAIATLKNAYKAANITSSTTAATSKTVTAWSRTAGSTAITITAASHGYGVGMTVKLAGIDASVNGTYTVAAADTNTLTVNGTATTALSATAQSVANGVAAVVGTVKTQSVAAGTASVGWNDTNTITITSWS